MDKSILEILSQLFASQSTQQANQSVFEQKQDNPAFANYPKEAFIQSLNSDQQAQQSQPGATPLSNLFGGGNNNNLFPLIMSMLGKNPNGLSGILEAITNNGGKEKKESVATNIDDEILL